MSERTAYDPTWLVKLAEAQYPDTPWLHAALRNCVEVIEIEVEPEYMVQFIDRMQGKFRENVVLIDPKVGRVVLDILTDGRVGGLSILEMPFSPEQH